MEERRMVRRERTTIIFDSDYIPVRWGSVKKLNIPDDDSFISLKVEGHEEKCWDDEGGTVMRNHWTLRTSYFSPENDNEFVKRVKEEEAKAALKARAEKDAKDAEYLTYLRLKAKYDDGEKEVPQDTTRSMEHGDK